MNISPLTEVSSKNVVTIGIAGGSGSGKVTTAMLSYTLPCIDISLTRVILDDIGKGIVRSLRQLNKCYLFSS